MAPDWAMARGDLVKEERFKKKYGVHTQDALGWENGLKDDLNAFIEHAKILKDAKGRLGKEIANSVATADSTPPEPDSKRRNFKRPKRNTLNP